MHALQHERMNVRDRKASNTDYGIEDLVYPKWAS